MGITVFNQHYVSCHIESHIWPHRKLDRVEGCFKGHILIRVPCFGNLDRVEGFRDGHAPFHHLLVCSLFRWQNFVYFNCLFGGINSFDRPDYLFDQFSTVLRKAPWPLFFSLRSYHFVCFSKVWRKVEFALFEYNYFTQEVVMLCPSGPLGAIFGCLCKLAYGLCMD